VTAWLFDERDGVLFTGDVVYDDILLDSCTGADPEAYRRSLRRLRDLDVGIVFPGHGRPFGRDRFLTIIDNYLKGDL
jgi:glyoxylase-like metal-dependent hydrolase (beta-lactamase superfamily II)